MKSHEAIELLRGFQAQIIHGKNTFGEIADVIEHLEVVRGELQESWEKSHEAWRSTQARLHQADHHEPAMKKELIAYLDSIAATKRITSENIGDIRRMLFMPFDCDWNVWVRDLTAERENCETTAK